MGETSDEGDKSQIHWDVSLTLLKFDVNLRL